MKKTLPLFGTLLLSVLLFTGCGSQPSPQAGDAADRQIVYSNLTDDATQKEVAELLESHGVSAEQTDVLLSWADDFNERITSGALPEGFRTMPESGADYSGLIIENKEAEDGFIYPEANCRLTSYLLMKNMIHTNGKHTDGDTFLIFDAEAIDSYEPFSMSADERDGFVSLFSSVPVSDTGTLEEHIARIQDAWKDREIKIKGDGISLITVYLHSPFDEVRFVGHTGVLLENGNGLVFVEKYGPQFPFQATKFHNREELKHYLLGRSDLYGDETELAPIVLENNQLLA